MSNTIASALARTDWKLLARQKRYLVQTLSCGLIDESERHYLDGILLWIDAIQEAAEAEGYPVEFLAE